MARHKKPRRKRGGLIIIILILLIAFAFYDSNTRITVSEYEVGYEDLPDAFNGYKIVQLSDLHATYFGEGNSDLIEKVKDADPNIIAVTGDLIDSDDQGDYVRELMPQLTAIAPVYFVNGNHEWASGGLRELYEILDDCGVVRLSNEYEIISAANDSIVLAGVEDPNGPADMETPEEFMSRIRENEGDKFVVMLYHRNDMLGEFSNMGADLVMCGHAHGGTVRLPFTDGLIGPSREFFPEHTAGVYSQGDTDMIVSRGFGKAAGVPRLFNNPDMVEIILKTN